MKNSYIFYNFYLENCSLSLNFFPVTAKRLKMLYLVWFKGEDGLEANY